MEIQKQPEYLSTDNRGYRDRQAALVRDLSPLVQITGRDLVLKTIRGDLLSLDVDRTHLVAVCRFLRDQLGFELLSCISGVDMLDHLEAVYHLRLLPRRQILQLKVRVDNDKPEVDSVVSVWPTANWHEREIYDLFGVRFIGHPDLRRILLDDDFEGYPLLKRFHQVPLTVKDRATTQVDPNMAVAGDYQTKGYEHVVMKKLGQGMEERLHPGTPTFGHMQGSVQEQANEHAANPEGESATGKSEQRRKESRSETQ
ncbi:MAG: NADH-quinone oxidoreductase subunit C [Chloroflexi bacterium]|nr:MAG: NADH-quinone oxidoreductase subunit C [Chloroflexota bacterium]